MQLIVGGMGFVGLHVARALLNLGEPCVLVRHRRMRVPDFIKEEIGARILIEQADAFDAESLRAIGRRRRITGIIHLANGTARVESFPSALQALFNVLAVAGEWKVGRVAIASTIGSTRRGGSRSASGGSPPPDGGIPPNPYFHEGLRAPRAADREGGGS